MNTYTEVELKRLKNIKSIKTVKLSFEFSNVWLVQCGSRESITQFDSGGGGGRVRGGGGGGGGECSHIVVGIAGDTSLGGNF